MSRFGTGRCPVRNALVPLEPASLEAPRLKQRTRGDADFIAHLIATATRAPQTCGRRRVSVGEATSLYNTVDRQPAAPGRGFSRSL